MVSAGLILFAEKVDCDSPVGGVEESYCADRKYKAADKTLNDVFKKAKNQMSKGQVKLLLAAQKGWLQLRDNQCALEVFPTRGTTGNNGQDIDCLTELTKQRTKQIDSHQQIQPYNSHLVESRISPGTLTNDV